MKILLLNQFFHPDESGSSVLLSALAEDLARAGHEVSVLTSTAVRHRPRACPTRREIWKQVEIRRVYCGLFDSRQRLRRFVSYARYLWGVAWRLLCCPPRAQVALVASVPPALPWIAAPILRWRRIPFVCWVHSVSPDREVARGWLHPRSWSYRRLEKAQRRWMNRAAEVIVPGACMVSKLTAHGITPERIAVLPDFAPYAVDSSAADPLPAANPFRVSQGLGEQFVVLCSGTLEEEHRAAGLETAMWELAFEPRLRFVVAGEGSWARRLYLEGHRRRLPNLTVLPWQRRRDLQALFAAADIAVVTMPGHWAGIRSSHKYPDLLAAGRPILYLGAEDTDMAKEIRKYECGWVLPPNQLGALVTLLQALLRDSSGLAEMGMRARHAYLAHHCREKIAAEWERLLARAVGREASAEAPPAPASSQAVAGRRG